MVCPACRGALDASPDTMRCLSCGSSYAIRQNVACFAPEDEFYETRYEPASFNFVPDERLPWNRALLYLVSMHYLWFIRRFVRPGSAILDVACGGGTRYLSTRGSVAGLDVSFQLVRGAADVYAEGPSGGTAIQGSAFEVPYVDGSFDAIVAKFFFEHIAPDDKPILLREFSRLLKPDGRLVMLFDCDSSNSLWRWAKRDPELFQKHFIENDGHYGLMSPSASLQVLRQAGFRMLAFRASNKTPLVHLSMLSWLKAYKGRSRLLDRALPLVEAISQRRLATFAYTFGVTLWDDLVEPLLPLDKARYLLVACEKKDLAREQAGLETER